MKTDEEEVVGLAYRRKVSTRQYLLATVAVVCVAYRRRVSTRQYFLATVQGDYP